MQPNKWMQINWLVASTVPLLPARRVERDKFPLYLHVNLGKDWYPLHQASSVKTIDLKWACSWLTWECQSGWGEEVSGLVDLMCSSISVSVVPVFLLLSDGESFPSGWISVTCRKSGESIMANAPWVPVELTHGHSWSNWVCCFYSLSLRSMNWKWLPEALTPFTKRE